ncbi:Dipeptidyl aminopeptidase/acylaminoacyl peptidase [Flavobacterium fryxellicola]|uniref:Peptidase S9 prolyl oligopeptidase catalytic domain-containing protein n=1 Tax=Flavobacterium fryxellicola TaxID=249352 RepID=A0A167VAF8_9FLAO|nr:prolyl oligopeptidase family serine peptidase [Flavobacterium fryxellicola]OAB26223.1 hypothetical protein FBFR_13375 [Flavobacterium fryxellicola]SHN79633.1 Dipeptidyl aminopeptidase/acylaminoacyl peptidase [Flavobacterium fryxellicola]
MTTRKKYRTLGRSSYLVRLIRLLLLSSSSLCIAQLNPKKVVTAADYSLWGKLTPQLLSDNGTWISYSTSYSSHQDTLFVKNTATLQTHLFPKGQQGKFSKEAVFAYYSAPNTLAVFNLQTAQTKTLKSVNEYFFTTDDQYLIVVSNSKKYQKILICLPNGHILKTIDSINNYSFNPDSNILAITSKNSTESIAQLIILKENFRTLKIANSSKENFGKMKWNKGGTALSFYGSSSTSPHLNPKLYYYSVSESKLHFFDSNTHQEFPKDMLLSTDSEALTLSDDGNKVFIQTYKKTVIIKDTAMVWNTKDQWLYMQRPLMENHTYNGVWFPKNNRFLQITDHAISGMMLNGLQNVALLFDSRINEAQFNEYRDLDYWLIDLETGKKKLFLEKYANDGTLFALPDGDYFCYLKDGDWWVYSISKATHTNITKYLKVDFYEKKYVAHDKTYPFGLAGWSEDNRCLLLYDAFDVWEITPDGSIAKRLTNGREDNIVYRIVSQQPSQQKTSNFSGFTSGYFNLDYNLYLSAERTDFSDSGYSVWNRNRGIQSLVFQSKKVDYLTTAKKGSSFMYLEQTFEQSPTLVFKTEISAAPTVVYQSNLQQQHFLWGKSKAITYKDISGNQLKGVLNYPAGYDPLKKYPMIVRIYENQAHNLHKYVNPSLYNSAGFNVSNLTSQGFFVLYPDIVYQEGQPGQSALDCVLAAVDEALSTASISPTHIGLIGHSFGGYETNFIVTHSNRFSAAVSGAGISDFYSLYLRTNGITGNPNYFRFESQQFRMGTSFFDNKWGYLNNSPLFNAENMNTPLLSWTGESDTQIHSSQSMQFFMALRRLEKTHTLLVYPNEEHGLEERMNQRHLTLQIEKWLAHYLRKEDSL